MTARRCSFCTLKFTSIDALERHAITHPEVRALEVAIALNRVEAERSRIRAAKGMA